MFFNGNLWGIFKFSAEVVQKLFCENIHGLKNLKKKLKKVGCSGLFYENKGDLCCRSQQCR